VPTGQQTRSDEKAQMASRPTLIESNSSSHARVQDTGPQSPCLSNKKLRYGEEHSASVVLV